MMTQLRRYLLDNPEFDAQFLMLDESTGYDLLPDAEGPAIPDERKLLESLREKLAKHLEQIKPQEPSEAPIIETPETQLTNAELYAR